MVAIWPIPDTVKPSGKNSVRYNPSSRIIDVSSFQQLNYSLIQKAPHKQQQYIIKFSVLELIEEQFQIQICKNFRFTTKTHNSYLIKYHFYKRYFLKYNTLSYQQKIPKDNPTILGNSDFYNPHKKQYRAFHENNSPTSISDYFFLKMYNENTTIDMEINPMHNSSSSITNNDKRKYEDSEQTGETPTKVQLTESPTVQMELPISGTDRSLTGPSAAAADTTGGTAYSSQSAPLMTWSFLAMTIEPLRNLKYDPADLNKILTLGLTIHDDDIVLIMQRRENIQPLETVSRELFDEWLLPRNADQMVQHTQGIIALQFINILKQELLADMHSVYRQEREMVVGLLLPPDTTRHRWEHFPKIEQHYSEVTQSMYNKIEDAVAATSAAFPKLWRDVVALQPALVDPIAQLTEAILEDMPSLGDDVQQLSQKVHSLTMQSLESSQQADISPRPYRRDREYRRAGAFAERSLLTDDAVINCLALKTYRIITKSDVTLAHRLTMHLRKVDADLGHVSRLELPKNINEHIEMCTITDRQAGYGQYSVLCGFLPLPSLEATIKELQHVYEQIGVEVCVDWITVNYDTHGWAIRRHHDALCYSPGYIIKHRYRQVFGTVKRSTVIHGSIYPLSAVLKPRAKAGRSKFFFMALLDPVDLQKLQLPDLYGSICVLRDIPFGKDKSALTSATLFSTINVMNAIGNGHITILPILHYHTVFIHINEQRRGWGMREYVHPEDVPPGNPAKMQRELIPELLLDVIYTGTEEGVTKGTESPSFRKAQQDLFDKLQHPVLNSADPSPIYFRSNGLGAEMLLSVGDCLDIPRRNPLLRAETGLFINHVPRGCLAEDVLSILAAEPNNHPSILKLESAVYLPGVPEADRPHRVLLLGSRLSERDIDLEPLSRHIHATVLTPTEPSMRRLTVEGRGEIHKLQEMLESHYSTKDSQVNQHTTDQHTPAIRVSNFASTFVPPPPPWPTDRS